MSRGIVAAAVALALVGGTARANAASTVSAQVDSVATVTFQNAVVFEFDVYNCPAGEPLAIVDWEAHQPSRPESIAFSGLQAYGASNGDNVQHLSLLTGAPAFLAGELWVGSGHVACGAVVVPVEGSGQTRSLNGV